MIYKVIILAGDHARVRAQAVSKMSGMGMFTVKKPTCVNCRCILESEDSAPVCVKCEKEFSKVYMKLVSF